MSFRKPALPLVVAGALAAGLVAAGPAVAGPPHCPPGLAKKGSCLPPGQAKKRYAVGHPLPAGVGYVRIDDWWRYGLGPPPAGAYYVRVDRDVLLMQYATRQIIEAIGAVAILLN